MNAFSGASGAAMPDDPEISSISGISEFVAEVAAHAPSIYNSSPWWFSTVDADICVRADSERTVPIVDPAGRELTMSCGAAAFTVRIALRYLGLIAQATVLPEPGIPNLVVKLTWGEERKQPSDYERRLFDQIAARRTHWGGFSTDRLPGGLMSTLTEAAARENATLRIMTDDDHRAAILAVVAAADCAFGLDKARVAEEAKWMPSVPGPTADRGWGARPQAETTEPGSPGVVAVLTTPGDERVDWIHAGQALQRVLLVAGSNRVSVAMDATALEFGHLRQFIGSEIVGGDSPQMVLRFGLTGHA